jgi:hypothetical protein
MEKNIYAKLLEAVAREFDTSFTPSNPIILLVKPFVAYFFVKFYNFIRAILYYLCYNSIQGGLRYVHNHYR